MKLPGKLSKRTRSLRFRLTISYVVFFSLLLGSVGVLFRQALVSLLDRQARALLEEEWAAVNGYLRFERRRQHEWFYDPTDQEDAAIVERLRRYFLLTDAEGNVMEASNAYRVLGVEKPNEVRTALRSSRVEWKTRRASNGEPYLVRAGLLHDDRRRAYFMAIALPLAENERTVEGFTVNYFVLLPVMILASSLLGWFLAGRALRPLHDVSKTAQNITGSNLDLRIVPRGSGDELDHLIETFNRMMERLAASFEQIRQFSTDVSHELRTPLTAIRGQLEVALFTARTPEQYREAMVNALEDVERLGQIVKALLLLSQSESGQLALQKSAVELSSLVLDVVDQFQIPAEAAQVNLTAELPEPCTVQADRIQIERLVSNLLSNAIKYTGPGGRVSVRLRREAEEVLLEVEDNGQGIPAGDLPHIFDRFYRVQSAEHSPEKGLGLGLSFVAWIAKAHGGRVEVASVPGEGSRFLIRLPQGDGADRIEGALA
ncbi:MAG: heavy metal sensor histidine kinase [Acidobacteria bacterium]|nr:heavy metal sensor histidine kinase [Acidobacteriota bacterium]